MLNTFPIEFVVFDLDGTLVDSLPDMLFSLNDALRAAGLPPVEEEEMRAATNAGLAGMAAAALALHGVAPEGAVALLQDFEQRYAARLCVSSAEFPGATSLLQWLAAKGIPCAVCTNKPESLARSLLAALDIDSALVPVVIGGDTTPEAKPSPRPLLEAIDQLGASPERTLLIGDSEVDLACGRNAGVRVVLVAHGYASDRLLYATHDAVCLDLPGVSDWLADRLSTGPKHDVHQHEQQSS